MSFPIHNVIFDVDSRDIDELRSVASIVLNVEQTQIFNAMYCHDKEYASRESITIADIREPVRAVYLQSFGYLISDRVLDSACALYYKWWFSIKNPNTASKVTLLDIAEVHELLTNEDAEYLAMYNANTYEDMYSIV